MSNVSEAYVLAERIHDSFFGENLLTAEERRSSSVIARIGSTSSATVKRIEVKSEHDGRIVLQTLARDKNGGYHLSTTFQEDGGVHVPLNIYEDAPLEVLESLVDSIFMHKLVAIAHARNQV